MRKIILLILSGLLFFSCENRVWDNPVDPDSGAHYIGYESIDSDGDGIGRYGDIDEVENLSPVNLYVLSEGNLALECSSMDSDIVQLYRIEIGETDDFSSVLITETGESPEFGIDLIALENNTTYYWRSSASDGNRWSDEAQATVFSFSTFVTPPDAPSDLNLANHDDGYITVSWVDGSNNEDGFYIFRKSGTGDWELIETADADTESWLDSTTTAGIEYTYRIQAWRAVAESDYTTEESLTAAIAAPAVPTFFNAWSGNSGYINLGWDDNAGNEEGFRIYRKTASESVYIEIADLPENTINYDDYNCRYGIEYNYIIRSYRFGVESTDSAVLTTTSEIRDETVDSEGYAYSDIVIDGNNYPHISYQDESWDINYSYEDDSGWHSELVKEGNYQGNSITLDSNGYPHISYIDGGNETVHYSRWNGSSWVHEDVGFNFDYNAIHVTSIVLDVDDNPHITYDNGSNLGYSRKVTGSWEYEDFSNNVGSDNHSSLAFDAEGVLHIAYCTDTARVVHCYGSLGNWTTEEVADAGGKYTGMAIGSDDSIHMAWNRFSSSTMYLSHAVYDGVSWTVSSSIDSNTKDDWNNWLDLDLDSDNRPHISYYSGSSQDLKYAYQTASGWIEETINGGSYDYGYCNSIAVDGNDNPHFAYCRWVESGNGVLHYSH